MQDENHNNPQQDFDPLLLLQRFGVQSRSLGDFNLFGYTNLCATIWVGWKKLEEFVAVESQQMIHAHFDDVAGWS
jgi:hypothetical protein